MWLDELSLDNVRSIEHVELRLHPGINLVWGGNGSGKTSLLEGIFLLGRGRSFRTRTTERLIRRGEQHLITFGRLAPPISRAVGLRASRSAGTEAKVDGRYVTSLAELAHAFPVQVIEPGVHKLLEEGGYRRRRWLDWGVFHVEPNYAEAWARYARALKQRNAALRQAPDQSRAWDVELAHDGEAIAASRAAALERMAPYWSTTVHELTGMTVELAHYRGWDGEHSLAEALAAHAARDRLRGVTHAGPHRADVRVRLHGRPARDALSRGQQKLVAISMVLAQLDMLGDSATLTPTLLLDDPAAELDRAHLERFIAVVQRTKRQLVTTALTPDVHLFGPSDRVFHVERGGVRPV